MNASDQPGHWGNLGITGDARVEKLLFNRSSETIIAQIQIRQHGLYLNRLVFRAVKENKYHSIPVETKWDSHDDAFSCEGAPYLIFNTLRFSPPKSGTHGYAARWRALWRFNLTSGTNEHILGPKNIQVPPPYVSGWIANVLSGWPDGNGAVCKVGLEKTSPNKDEIVMDYFIYDVSFQDGLLRCIDGLPNDFL